MKVTALLPEDIATRAVNSPAGKISPKASRAGILIENSEVIALSCIFGELLQGIKNEGEEEPSLTFELIQNRRESFHQGEKKRC
jgi:hypothetical protein